MNKYHKINSIYKRDMENLGPNRHAPFIIGEYSKPEFEALKDIQWRFDEKVDGTNIRIGLKNTLEEPLADAPDVLDIRGRTEKSQIPKHLLAKLNEIFDVDHLTKVFTHDGETPEMRYQFTLYGEGYGVKIQKGGGDYFRGDPSGVGFILFDIRVGHMWLTRDSIEDLARQLGIPVVPVVGYGTLAEAEEMCKNGFKSLLRDSEPEGLICRPKVDLLDRRGGRIVTKVKLKDYR